MARIARHRGLLGLPADATLTPGTFDQVIALPPRRELLSKFLVLCPKVEMRCGPLVSLLLHIGHGSSSKVYESRKHRKSALCSEEHRSYQRREKGSISLAEKSPYHAALTAKERCALSTIAARLLFHRLLTRTRSCRACLRAFRTVPRHVCQA
jgi:hypothetical protein